jgi:hypothetical protein
MLDVITQNYKHSVRLPWTSDRPAAEAFSNSIAEVSVASLKALKIERGTNIAVLHILTAAAAITIATDTAGLRSVNLHDEGENALNLTFKLTDIGNVSAESFQTVLKVVGAFILHRKFTLQID